jgi:hypothetical protein
VPDILPLRWVLVRVNQATELVHFLVLRVRLRETPLLVHCCGGSCADTGRDVAALIWSICRRSVVEDVVVVILLDLFGLDDRDLLS